MGGDDEKFKASIGTEDIGEYCEADGDAEKKENVFDVEACKVYSDDVGGDNDGDGDNKGDNGEKW